MCYLASCSVELDYLSNTDCNRMPFKSPLKQSFAACLIILSLICFICLTSAYFTTAEMAEMEGDKDCRGVAAGEEEQKCAMEFDSHSDISPGDSVSERRDLPASDRGQEESKDPSCDSETGSKPTSTHSTTKDMLKRYMASMVLSGVGDAMGYHGGRWEFNYDGVAIHKELQEKYKSVDRLKLDGREWIVSDDTVMHLATAKALVEFGNKTVSEELYNILSKKYIECMKDMKDRAPGPTCIAGVKQMKNEHSYRIPFNSRGGGCGAAMRATCIGLRYPKEDQIDDLTAVSIESGRMTHHHPTGYLGSFAAALFTSYAIQGKPVNSWGKNLMTELKRAKKYIKNQKRDADENLKAWSYFENSWMDYLKERKISDGKSEPEFPRKYDVEERDNFYKKLSFSGWGGSSGHDAPMIAYDALLGSKDSWDELCKRGILHGGDNDSTGTIAGAWFGALYGLKEVPIGHYNKLEYREKLENLGKKIFELSSSNSSPHKGTAL